MGFIAPIIGPIATLVTTAVTIGRSTREQADQRRNREAQAAAAGEVLRKEQLLANRKDHLRQLRASGSGQNTILGGGGDINSQAEVGRNVLLGQ